MNKGFYGIPKNRTYEAPSLFTTASYALTASNVQGGTVNYIPLWGTDTSLVNSVMYQSTNNLGIGTVTPSYKLDVNGTTRLQNTLTISTGGANITGTTIVTGSLGVTAGITGSLFGTASWATNAVTASYPISVTGSTLYSTSPAAGPNFSKVGSILLGASAGLVSTNADNSNFLGDSAGYQALNASNSNFIGNQAGYQATAANSSNFLGTSAGQGAINASTSNFLGPSAGFQAIRADNSNFLGSFAGRNAVSASYSTLIGFQVGNTNSNLLSIGTNNIIIGTNITLSPQRRDSINIGGILFGTGSYSTTTGTTFSGSVGNGRIGINVVSPNYNLDVSGSGNFTNGLTVTGSLIMNPSGSFILPLTASASPQTGSAYWSGSFLFIYNGTRYMSASFA
jgi:hypothetical protein